MEFQHPSLYSRSTIGLMKIAQNLSNGMNPWVYILSGTCATLHVMFTIIDYVMSGLDRLCSINFVDEFLEIR